MNKTTTPPTPHRPPTAAPTATPTVVVVDSGVTLLDRWLAKRNIARRALGIHDHEPD